MPIVMESFKFIVFALCLYLGPFDSSMNIYVDVCENGRIKASEVEQGTGVDALQWYKIDEDGANNLRMIVVPRENSYIFSGSDVRGEVSINLSDYLGIEQLKKMKEVSGAVQSFNLQGFNPCHVWKRGSVTYLSFDDAPGAVFIIHD